MSGFPQTPREFAGKKLKRIEVKT